MRLAVRGWPGGELSMVWEAPVRGFCGRRPAAMTALAGGSEGEFVLVESSVATASGACVLLQTAGPLEWQQEEGRTQGCWEIAACICGVAARHRMPQIVPATGASTSRRIRARASCARLGTGSSVTCCGSDLICSRCLGQGRAPGFTVARSVAALSLGVGVIALFSAAGGRGRAVSARWRRRAARVRASRRGCAG